MTKEIYVMYGVDVDAVSGWLGSYGGQNSLHDISRGVWAGEVGVPRLLNLFKKYKITASWYWPGHSIETFPNEAQMVADAGHEIGAHGYSHENPKNLTLNQEESILKKSIELIKELTGKPPVGNVAPWWEPSENTYNLLLKYGFKYDKSSPDRDFVPFYARVGRTWTPIDYSKPAEEWMKPTYLGKEIDLVEFSGNWPMDDLPPMMLIKSSPNSYGYTNPHDMEQMWRDMFDWVYRELDYAVFPFMVHPDVSGRPDVLLMHERLISYINQHPGVQWITFEEAAKDFRKRFPFEKK